MTPAEAEMHFLDNVKKLSMYGVDLHHARVRKTHGKMFFKLELLSITITSCYSCSYSVERFCRVTYSPQTLLCVNTFLMGFRAAYVLFLSNLISHQYMTHILSMINHPPQPHVCVQGGSNDFSMLPVLH